MARTIRTVISVAFVGLCVWAAFSVPLGDKTLADHVDAIGETPEAEKLLDGARDTINPALDEVKDRILGEHVAAPTHLSSVEGDGAPQSREVAEQTAGQAPIDPGPPATARAVDDEPVGIYASDGASSAAAGRGPGPGRPSTGDRVRLPGQ